MRSGKDVRQKRSLKTAYSRLFELFAGSYVHMFIKNVSITKSKSKVIFAGYLLDEDDNFYYMGPTPEGVASGVSKSEVLAIMLADEVETLMDHMDIPSDSEMQ